MQESHLKCNSFMETNPMTKLDKSIQNHWTIKIQDSGRDFTMKFWRLIGFMTTGGPAVRGHDWNFLSVSSNHSLLETVPGIEPEERSCSYTVMKQQQCKSVPMEKYNLPPNIFTSETKWSQIHATPKDPIIADTIYLPDMIKK